MKTIIRQWLCRHEKSIWVNTETHTIETIQNPRPKTLHIKTIMMCEICGKFIKLDSGKLLNT
jgi:hypothetical protein